MRVGSGGCRADRWCGGRAVAIGRDKSDAGSRTSDAIGLKELSYFRAQELPQPEKTISDDAIGLSVACRKAAPKRQASMIASSPKSASIREVTRRSSSIVVGVGSNWQASMQREMVFSKREATTTR